MASEIWQLVKSPAWWFTAVIAGVVVNLLAAYVKPLTDRAWASWSAHYRSRLGAAVRRCEAIVNELRSSEHSQLLLVMQEIRDWVQTVGNLAMAGTVLLFYVVSALTPPSQEIWNVPAFAAAAGLILVAFNRRNSAVRAQGLLAEAGVVPRHMRQETGAGGNG